MYCELRIFAPLPLGKMHKIRFHHKLSSLPKMGWMISSLLYIFIIMMTKYSHTSHHWPQWIFENYLGHFYIGVSMLEIIHFRNLSYYPFMHLCLYSSLHDYHLLFVYANTTFQFYLLTHSSFASFATKNLILSTNSFHSHVWLLYWCNLKCNLIFSGILYIMGKKLFVEIKRFYTFQIY